MGIGHRRSGRLCCRNLGPLQDGAGIVASGKVGGVSLGYEGPSAARSLWIAFLETRVM